MTEDGHFHWDCPLCCEEAVRERCPAFRLDWVMQPCGSDVPRTSWFEYEPPTTLDLKIEEEETTLKEFCEVDLEKCDEYLNRVVPDDDVETCLRVLRTCRNVCLAVDQFDADGAVILSHAHAKIAEMVQNVQETERAERDAADEQSSGEEEAPAGGEQWSGDGGVV